MKFSKKSRYGVAALIDLAVNSKNGHVALGSIAERNEISPQYLEQVFASLRRAGIVKSVKGSQGGYLLKYPSSSITVASIIQALEGTYYLDGQEIGDTAVVVTEGVERAGFIDYLQKVYRNFMSISG